MTTTRHGGYDGNMENGMTVKQFRKKVETARKYGKANLANGSVLHYWGEGDSIVWSIWDKYGNTVDTACNPKKLEYLYK